MPEQPPDPLHYDMRIPPPPDPAKHREAEKPSSSESESDETAATTKSSATKVHVTTRKRKAKGRNSRPSVAESIDVSFVALRHSQGNRVRWMHRCTRI